MSASPATLISMIRRTPLPYPLPARILGVDDWAKRKGRSYATAIVDFESHRLIELLPDREAETLAHWLKANHGAEVISRDHSETYATGARQGAPEATQVADRWHLLHNWREAVERVFDRHRGRIKRVVLPIAGPVGKPAAVVLPAKDVNRRRKYLEEQRARAQAKRLALYEAIRRRHSKGEYLTTIARDLEIDYKTARKYALSDAEASRIREIQQFAYKVRWDEAAVKTGCTLPWSNGQTEGQITRSKAIKRSMYGRAKFDLLRRRALKAA